jgi:hypothetical protein
VGDGGTGALLELRWRRRCQRACSGGGWGTLAWVAMRGDSGLPGPVERYVDFSFLFSIAQTLFSIVVVLP